jgi:hypothetical protein
MPRHLIPPEPWWPEAADLMVRYDLSLREAAAELGVDGREILSLSGVSY